MAQTRWATRSGRSSLRHSRLSNLRCRSPLGLVWSGIHSTGAYSRDRSGGWRGGRTGEFLGEVAYGFQKFQLLWIPGSPSAASVHQAIDDGVVIAQSRGSGGVPHTENQFTNFLSICDSLKQSVMASDSCRFSFT